MFGIEITFPNGQVQRCHSRDTMLVIGKDPRCKIALTGWRVAARHAELMVSNDQVFIHDLQSASGTRVNGERVDAAGPLSPDDVIVLAGHEIRVQWCREAVPGQRPPRQDLPRPDTHAPTSMSVPLPMPRASKPLLPVVLEVAPTECLGSTPAPAPPEPAPECVPAADVGPPPHAPHAHGTPPLPEPQAPLLEARKVLHEQLVEAFGLRRTDVHRMADAELRSLTEGLLRELIGKLPGLPPELDRESLLTQVRDEAIGLGLLEPLLADAGITEIMVNAADEIFVERSGRLQRVPQSFTSDQTVLGIIERIVAPIGRRIDESSPMVDARLKDGSRVHAVIPPLALKGPALTIRKFPQRQLGVEDLLGGESASPQMIDFLQVCVEQRKNIVISGGTGSGKTTLLNILSNFIPSDERIVTLEDAAELQLRHANLVSMEARPANLEGKGQVTIRELVKNALRMRPDRIVVGECRGGEALDMLQAMNTGHDGSLTTAHANTPRDMLSRLEVMVLMAGMDLPVTAIREQIASAVHLIVQQSRLPCGARKITSIVEVTGIESGKIQLQEIFAHVARGFCAEGRSLGHFTGRGFVPEFYEKLAERGVPLDLRLFAIQPPDAASVRRVA